MGVQENTSGKDGVLVTMRGLRIEGQADDEWHEIVHGVDVTLRRGEVLGLIGESGAGKSTIGLAAMGYARDGCRISGGTILFDGMDLMKASDEEKRNLRGSKIAYVAQSAAASFNPANRLIDQYCEAPVQHGIKSRSEAVAVGPGCGAPSAPSSAAWSGTPSRADSPRGSAPARAAAALRRAG